MQKEVLDEKLERWHGVGPSKVGQRSKTKQEEQGEVEEDGKEEGVEEARTDKARTGKGKGKKHPRKKRTVTVGKKKGKK